MQHSATAIATSSSSSDTEGFVLYSFSTLGRQQLMQKCPRNAFEVSKELSTGTLRQKGKSLGS